MTKTALFNLILGTTLMFPLFGGAEEPLHIECMDGTFMYRHLGIKEEADGYHIMLSGESSELAKDLGLVPEEVTYSLMEVTFVMKKENCVISEKDRRLVSCGLPENTTLQATLQYYDVNWDAHTEVWEVPHLTLDTVDIVETNALGTITHTLQSRLYLAKKDAANPNQWIVGYDVRTFPEETSMSAGCQLQ